MNRVLEAIAPRARPLVLVGELGILASLATPWFRLSSLEIPGWGGPAGWLVALIAVVVVLLERGGAESARRNIWIVGLVTASLAVIAGIAIWALVEPQLVLAWGVAPLVFFHAVALVAPGRRAFGNGLAAKNEPIELAR